MTTTKERKQLADYRVGETFNDYLLLKEITLKESKTGSKYLDVTLTDKTGDINGKKWDAKTGDDSEFPAGTVVRVSGNIDEYQEVKQLKIKTMVAITDSRPENNPNLYMKTAPMEPKDMMNYIKEKVDEISQPEIKAIVRDILNNHYKSFMTHAAAKSNHHAFSGGLAYHTVSMLHIAEHVVNFYPDVNKSLLYGGILIHDIGKTDELDDVVSGSGYTMKGQLLGHISMIETEIVETAIRLGIDPDNEMVVLLRHLVLSHHGKLEWGSPVLPQTREAHALHYIDMLDARMNMTEEALVGIEDGDFSPKIWALNAPIYKPSINE